MSDNIGGKIKVFAQICAIMGAISSVIGGLMHLAEDEYQEAMAKAYGGIS